MSEIGTFLCPNFRHRKCLKSGQKCHDFGHSTKLDCFAIQGVIKNIIYINGLAFLSRFQTEKVRKWDDFVPISDCLGMGQNFRAPKSERLHFGHFRIYS